MTNRIDEKTVVHLADLARIKLAGGEAARVAGELGSILGYVDALQKVDTSHIPHDSVPGTLRNVWRSDAPAPASDKEAILNEAPMREGDYIAVKKVIDYGD